MNHKPKTVMLATAFVEQAEPSALEAMMADSAGGVFRVGDAIDESCPAGFGFGGAKIHKL